METDGSGGIVFQKKVFLKMPRIVPAGHALIPSKTAAQPGGGSFLVEKDFLLSSAKLLLGDNNQRVIDFMQKDIFTKNALLWAIKRSVFYCNATNYQFCVDRDTDFS